MYYYYLTCNVGEPSLLEWPVSLIIVQEKTSWTVLRTHHRYINNYGAIALGDVAKAGKLKSSLAKAALGNVPSPRSGP